MNNDRDNDSFRTSPDIYGGYDTDYEASYSSEEDSGAVGDSENIEEPAGKKPAKKKKRRKKHYLLRFVIFIAVIAGLYLFLTSSIFAIDEVRIEDNTLLSDNEIIELSGVSPGDNMFKATNHKVKKALTANPYIADVKIKRELPNIYTISVVEREPVAAIAFEEKYLILDAEGYVVDYSDETMYATEVKGIAVSEYKMGEIPKVDDTASLNQILKLLSDVSKSGMYFKRVDITSSFTVKCYVTDTLTCSGAASDIAANAEGIKVVLYDLDQKGVKRGVIQIGEDGYASFSPVTE